jgi:hypothetical protein
MVSREHGKCNYALPGMLFRNGSRRNSGLVRVHRLPAWALATKGSAKEKTRIEYRKVRIKDFLSLKLVH